MHKNFCLLKWNGPVCKVLGITCVNIQGLLKEEYSLLPVRGRVLRTGAEEHAVLGAVKLNVKETDKSL